MKRIYPQALTFVASAIFLYLILCHFSCAPVTMLTDNDAPEPVQSTPLYPIRTKKTFTLVNDLVRAYCWRSQDALESVQPMLDKIAAIDAEDGKQWRSILEYWDYVNNDMELNDCILPDGLNDTGSLCLVILGFELRPDGSPRKELIGRLEAALQSAEKYPNARILCSGGITDINIGISEATVMSTWLIEHDIDPERIILERKSTSTVDNIRFTLRLLTQEYPDISEIAVISSDYHIRSANVMFQTKIILDNLPISLVSHAAYPTPMRDSGVKQVQLEGILALAGLMLP